MKQLSRLFVSVSFVWLVLVAMSQAQAVPASATAAKAMSDGTTTASRLVSISGVLNDRLGKPLTGVQGVTFALYKEQSSGAPLWLETQNVTVDSDGRFTALLGATKSEGLPLDLFSNDEARWLGVQAIQSRDSDGAVLDELPRILLVSVPYALKAADAETLGGKPASAFVLADASRDANPSRDSKAAVASASADGSDQNSQLSLNTAAVTGTGSTDRVVKWLDGPNGVQGDANITSAGSGFVGVGTTTPTMALDVAGTNAKLLLEGAGTHEVQISGDASFGRLGQDGGGFFFSSDTSGKALRFATSSGGLAERMRITHDGLVGIGTDNPGEALQVERANAGLVLRGTGTHQVRMTGDASSGRLGQDSGGFFFASDTSGKAIRFATSSGGLAERMRITPDGNVGIATAMPAAKLDVNGTIAGDGASITNLNAGNIASGTLGVARGGTGATTLTNHGVLLGQGTGGIVDRKSVV